MINQPKVGAVIVAPGKSQRIALRSYSLTQLRNYSFEEFLLGLNPPDIQLGGAESPNHGFNESSLTKLLSATELRC